MKKIPKKPISAEKIAKMTDRGEDISPFFTNKGKMMPPIGKVVRKESTQDTPSKKQVA
jgi:hypothetical protein